VLPGVAGGYVVSGERIGRAIGRILQQKEPDIAGIPGYVFDYPTVQRLHLQNIPPTAQLLNRPQIIWEQYLWQIIAGLSLIGLEGILISALVLALRSRRQMLTALHDERKQLEERVLQRTMELQIANDKLEQLATTDPLTGIGNRRRMTEQINKELERSRRFKHPLSLLMLDIDHFKTVNDSYGHEAGDRALIAVSKILAAGMRSVDMASRFGGEEFVLLMPETDIQVAGNAAERLRAQIAALQIPGDGGEMITLTISIGVAASDTHGTPDTASSLLSRADKALYRAKHGGRDRVVCA
jgi:diguanylate cyclase (GGDEF)-like protein